MLLLWSADFFKINFFKKLFQEHYLSVKQFGSRSGPTECPKLSLQRIFADNKSCCMEERFKGACTAAQITCMPTTILLFVDVQARLSNPWP